MPRFSLKTMLIAFAAVALWFSSAAGYAAANDVRRSVLFLILVASGFAAIYLTGKRRAFWAGFFAAMFLCGNSGLQPPFNLRTYVPDFVWLSEYTANSSFANPPTASVYVMPALTPVAPVPPNGGTATPARPYAPPIYPTPPPPLVRANPNVVPLQYAAVGTAWILLLAAASGFVAAAIYEYGRTLKGSSASLTN
jgi:hypothetical protein